MYCPVLWIFLAAGAAAELDHCVFPIPHALPPNKTGSYPFKFIDGPAFDELLHADVANHQNQRCFVVFDKTQVVDFFTTDAMKYVATGTRHRERARFGQVRKSCWSYHCPLFKQPIETTHFRFSLAVALLLLFLLVYRLLTPLVNFRENNKKTSKFHLTRG